MTTTYVHTFTEYEVEANERDAAKHAQKCNDDECSRTEYEVEACKRDVMDAHTFTAATVMAATKHAQKCNDDECSLTEHEVHSYDQQSETYSHIFTAAPAMSAKIERRAVLDAEIPALEAEIAAATEAKTKRSAELDAEITALMV